MSSVKRYIQFHVIIFQRSIPEAAFYTNAANVDVKNHQHLFEMLHLVALPISN